jgi:peptide-methionine (R)-S-oxide reductase
MSESPSREPDLRARLTPQQYHVTQERGTEPAFTGCFWNHHEEGVYACVVCAAPLFDSTAKFDSGSGWPSYVEPMPDARVGTKRDPSHGMMRTEVHCGQCGAHLGHVFDDGPPPTGQRYCINSAALQFHKR